MATKKKAQKAAAAKSEPTTADVLDGLVERYGAKYEKERKDGQVIVRLTNGDGERLAGRADTTAEAVQKLAARAAEVWNA